ELGRQVAGRLEPQIERRGLAGLDLRGRLAVEIVADRADGDGVRAGLEPVRREAVAAVLVGDDRDGDDSTGLLGTDYDAFHGAFGRRGDLAGERVGRLREHRWRIDRTDCESSEEREYEAANAHHDLPECLASELFSTTYEQGRPSSLRLQEYV